jgi:N-sulfoglucosamine sulfohydrolase
MSEYPNVLVLHCHDLGRFLGCYGHPTVRTPNLDQLAAEGVRLDRMFATAPQCSPSRASLFTGRWPHANGVMGLTHEDFAWDLHPGERHLGGRLRTAGYRSVLLGVHHESRVRPDREIAARLGFDHVDTSQILASQVADLASSHLERLVGGDRPFYLQVGFYEPHRLSGDRDPDGTMGFLGDHIEPDAGAGIEIPPYLLDTESAREEIAELQGAVAHMDRAAGRVLGQLDRLGIADDTLVVFTTDHGLALPRAKCSLYDPGLEVAMIIRYPGRGWSGGRAHMDLLSNLDLVPTLLELLDLDEDTGVQGRSFLGLLDGGSHRPREEVFGELTYHDYYDPRRCIRTERHKLIANFSSAYAFMDPSQSWHRRCTPRVEPVAYHPSVELYDLVTDPHELTDLATGPEHAQTVVALSDRLLGWMAGTGDPLLSGAVTAPLHTTTLAALAAGRDG